MSSLWPAGSPTWFVASLQDLHPHPYLPPLINPFHASVTSKPLFTQVHLKLASHLISTCSLEERTTAHYKLVGEGVISPLSLKLLTSFSVWFLTRNYHCCRLPSPNHSFLWGQPKLIPQIPHLQLQVLKSLKIKRWIFVLFCL